MVSIIIPVYNTSKYLPECLDSVINQTLKEIEIICIDDCSTDDSWKILQDYEKTDSRIKIFRQEKNMRQGAARNRGLKEASGKYIWFIDSDDFINKEACQLLYDTAEKNNVQILTFNLVSFIDSDDVSGKEAHAFSDWKVITAATEDKYGKEERTCSVCGYKETRTIERLAHTHTYDETTYS